MATADSPLIGPPSGTLDAAIDYLGAQNAEYLRELWRLCGLVGLDAAVLASQFSHETADGTSPVWRERLNPAGIGWTGDPAQNAASQIWANQTDAARGHVAHMVAYVGAFNLQPERLGIPRHLNTYDQRWQHVLNQPWANEIETIRDLTGKWATDSAYHDGIVRKWRAIFGEGEAVTTPTIYNLSSDYARFGLTQIEAQRIIDNRFTNRVQNGVQGRIEYLVYHIQDGTTVSSLDWWANGPDVQASSNYMVQRDGSILVVIPEAHGPWTNGDDLYPTPAGQPLVDLPGNSNIWSVTIEAEGTPADPPTNYPAQMDALEWLSRDLMRRHPVLQQKKRRIRHADVNRIGKPACPGVYYPVLMARLDDPVDPPVNPEPPYPPVEFPVWWADSLEQQWPNDADWNGLRYRVIRRNAEALKDAIPRVRPDTKAPQAADKVLTRTKINVHRTVDVPVERNGKTAQQQWLVTENGYLLASSFTPRMTIKPR